MKNKFVIEDAQVTVEGNLGGRKVELKTQTKATVTVGVESTQPKYYEWDKISSGYTNYTLDVDLEETSGTVFTFKRFPIRVTKTATAPTSNEPVAQVAKLLSVGEGYTYAFNSDKTVTFTWEEEIK